MKTFHLLITLFAAHAGEIFAADSSVAESRVSSSNVTRRSSNDEEGDQQPHLRIANKLKAQSLTSGDRFQLKCRVDAWPSDQIKFTWYKDSEILTEANDDNRIAIRQRSNLSKLTIRSLLTSDAGTYRCEASNGVFSDESTARLNVMFSLPPEDDHETIIPDGKCEIYKGEACQSLLKGKRIYVDPFKTQDEMEKEISEALTYMSNLEDSSQTCRHYAYPAFCYFVFSPCEKQYDAASGKRKAQPVKLCREDCELMKYDVCLKEFMRSKSDLFLKSIFDTADCIILPAISSTNKCTKTGLPSVVNQSHRCYNDTGVDYKGTASVTEMGRACLPWPSAMVFQHKELAGGHNYCRNPDKKGTKPWCFVEEGKKGDCQLEKCAIAEEQGLNPLIILVPVISVSLIVVCIIVAVCITRRKKGETTKKKKATPSGEDSNKTPLLPQANVPELEPASLKLLEEIGESQFGKVYKAAVLPNLHLNTALPFVAKTWRSESRPIDKEAFEKELQLFSALQHENVACLKAYIRQPRFQVLVFEHTRGFDLHEYLVQHSPNSDVYVSPGVDTKQPRMIHQQDFIAMTIQISSGLEYLSSNNFIHRDLAARNILVCGNLELKISDLGAIRDAHLSCYYRTPLGGQMWPIRWMSPESIQNWKFSDKSTVWSFGVLLWEMFSYGLQPYCGFGNHEVLEMISRRQLLPCPDQCPAKMYSLMQECWSTQVQLRPSFKEILGKLHGWESSSSKRMTSQLAQGINQHLSNVMNDGVMKYTPGQIAMSVDGSSSSNTRSTGAHYTQSPPPPHYSSCVQSALPPRATTEDPGPLGISPPQLNTPQQDCNRPFPTNPLHHEVGYNANYPPTSNARQYRKGPGSQSSRTSSSCGSTRQRNNQAYQNVNRPDDRNVAPFHGRNDLRDAKGIHSNLETRMSSPPLTVKTNSSMKEARSEEDATNKVGRNYGEHESLDVSASSLRATSCDSGLPTEDMDSGSPAIINSLRV